jgi:hypothetical protein
MSAPGLFGEGGRLPPWAAPARAVPPPSEEAAPSPNDRDRGHAPDATLCAGCGRPIGAGEAVDLADGTQVHFTDYACLLRYGERPGDKRQQAIREEFWRSVDPARCGGCGEIIGADERAYDYYDPQRSPMARLEILARCHSENLACLIAWNERWHAAEGHQYDAAHYRHRLERIER